MTKAHALFTATPKRHNCAQAVLAGCDGAEEDVAQMATCGGGRAPGGLCGALYAAIRLCPEHADAIREAFAREVGATTCRDIKSTAHTPCPVCVETAAKLVEHFRKDAPLSNSNPTRKDTSMNPIQTPNAPAAIGPYSQAIIANGQLFASGQIPVDPATGTIPEGIAAQAEQACKNCGALLAAAGLDFSKVIKTTCFLADIADFATFNEVYARYFTSKPARSCVAVRDIPKGCLCEIEILALAN